MLHLDTFEANISKEIVQRGKSYFTPKKVLYLEESDDNSWSAEVEGSEVYSVEIELKGKNIKNHFCDCPYDGSICKHVVAVLFALREKLKSGKVVSPKTSKSKKVTIEELVQKIEVKELRNFIVQFASSDKDFTNKFQVYFADKDERIDVGKKYSDLIKKAIRSNSDRGYIDYRASKNLSRELDSIVASGQQLIDKNNFKDALKVSQVILKETIAVIESCDDSSGSIGGSIADSISLLENIAISDASSALKEELFAFCEQELRDKIYFSYGDFDYQLLDVAEKSALAANIPERYLSMLDLMVSGATGKYENYRNDHLRTRKIAFLKKTNKTAEAEKLVEENLDIVEVRQAVVQEAIAQKNYAKAKTLINNGIFEAEKKEHPGIVSQWKKVLLDIAVLEKDVETIRYYTKYFAFDRGFAKDYYNQWKRTFPADEWHLEIEKLIQKVIYEEANRPKSKQIWQNQDYSFHRLFPIYIEEKYWDRLLTLTQNYVSLDNLQKVHPYLAKLYPQEMLVMYEPIIYRMSEIASGRSDYHGLAKLMIKIKKEIAESKDLIFKWVSEFKAKYPKRPAFIEELNGVLH